MDDGKKAEDATEALEEVDVQGHDADEGDQDYSITITGGTCL